jgi:MFS family permease
MLIVILAFNSVDGIALGLFLQDIKRDFQLTDTQLGFLTGTSFAIFWALAGVPIARWADRDDRVTIMSITTAIWGVAVILCGFAQSFVQLVLVRIAVAVGESGCMPIGNSLIADYFGRADRPRAIARYLLATPLSVLIGYLLSGWLGQHFGWRTAFVVLGIPGVALAVLARLTLKDPRQSEEHPPDAQDSLSEYAPSATVSRSSTNLLSILAMLRDTWGALIANKTYLQLVAAFSVIVSFDFGRTQWLPSFFIRKYAVGTTELGFWLTVIYGLGGAIALYGGGELASRYAAKNERLQLRLASIAYIAAGVGWVAICLSSRVDLVFALLGVNVLLSAFSTGPIFAMIQTMVPARLHAQSVAILLLLSRLIGMGLGPLLVGVSSDALQSRAGKDSLGYVLMFLCPGNFWAAWHVWRASRTVTTDIAAANKRNTQVDIVGEAIVQQQ